MPGGKRLMSIGILYLGVPGVFGVPGVVALGVPGVVTIDVPVRVAFGVPDGYMFTVFCHNSLRPSP